MATQVRSMFVAAFAALIFTLLPDLASAQLHVHEVRPARADEVRIGVDGPASMDEIVALAQRITGNEALTVDDVIANLPHPRRYVCRVGGRMVYFGTDPGYAGRCPEEGVRSDGTLRGAVYPIPRAHGVTLTPTGPERERPPVVASGETPSDEHVADLEARVQAMTLERDEARRARDRVQSDLDAVRTEVRDLRASATTVPAPPDPALRDAAEALPRLRGEIERERTLREEAEAANRRAGEHVHELDRQLQELSRSQAANFATRVHSLPVWMWAILAFMLTSALAVLVFGYLVLPREKRPLENRINVLEQARSRAEQQLSQAQSSSSAEIAAERKLFGDLSRKLKRTVKSRARWFKHWQATVADLESYADRFTAFQVRKDRIATNHAKLMELRQKEDRFDVLQLQIMEAQDALPEADEKLAEDYRLVIKQCTDEISRLPFDPGALKAEIAGLVAMIRRDMELQCGLRLDGRASDEWKAEWEDRVRKSAQEARAEKLTLQRVIAQVERRALDGIAELKSRRAELEHEFTEKEREVSEKEGSLIGGYMAHGLARQDAEVALKEAHDDNVALQVELDECKRSLMAYSGNESASAQALLERDAMIDHLAQRLREAGIDPGKLPPTPFRGAWPEEITEELPLPGKGNGAASGERHPRRSHTLTVGASDEELQEHRDSQIPAPPATPVSAMNRSIYKLLASLEALPQEHWTLDASDAEARDWAYLLRHASITSPQIKSVPLRHLVKVVEREVPDWLLKRARMSTDPPPAHKPEGI